MRVGEPSSLSGQFVNVGRLDFGRAVTTKVAVAEVISEDQNDVRLLGETVAGN